jgi:Peroxidase
MPTLNRVLPWWTTTKVVLSTTLLLWWCGLHSPQSMLPNVTACLFAGTATLPHIRSRRDNGVILPASHPPLYDQLMEDLSHPETPPPLSPLSPQRDQLIPATHWLRALQSSGAPMNLTHSIEMATQQVVDIIESTQGGGVNWAAKFVRLSFHDCVGGICDGCVDLLNPSNFGLEAPIDILDPIVQLHSAFLTTGDVWALAGLTAARTAQQVDEGAEPRPFALNFVQRPHCGDTKRGPHHELPKASLVTSQLTDFFATHFGFTKREVVTILGECVCLCFGMCDTFLENRRILTLWSRTLFSLNCRIALTVRKDEEFLLPSLFVRIVRRFF